MSPRIYLSIFLGKLIILLTQKLKFGGGSAAPGYYALKLYPQLVADLGSKIPKTILVTGTNGKTTTSRLIAHFTQNSGLKVIRNVTGSNLERGIASALISSANLPSLNITADLAIWELDEAAFNYVALKIKPDIIIFLNVFRDQLDRYGEVDITIKKWFQTLSKLPSTTQLIINGDDNNLLAMKNSFPKNVQTFGIEGAKIRGEKHLGKVALKKLDFKTEVVDNSSLDKTVFIVKNKQTKVKFELPIPGVYNIYNFLAAYICASNLSISTQTIISSLKDFSPAFGRVEKFMLPPRRWKHNSEGYIFLIKNPTGATQVFQTINKHLKIDDRLLLVLNDNIADGKDVSWIWDINFNPQNNFTNPNSFRENTRNFNIICSGTRAEELALRLKYAGFDPNQLKVENSLKMAFEEAARGLSGRLFILPTYTALLSLQSILAKSGIKKQYWKEN